MSYRLSILDKSPVGETETAAIALVRTLQLAQLAEAWGYHRFWIAEHHNTPQLASPSPELVIARILAKHNVSALALVALCCNITARIK